MNKKIKKEDKKYLLWDSEYFYLRAEVCPKTHEYFILRESINQLFNFINNRKKN